jgi:hypothetical protein
MARGFEVGSRAGRLTALALLTFAVSIPAAVLAGRTPAGWQPGAARQEGHGSVPITSNRISGLYPGARKTLTLTLHNFDSRHGIVVRRVRVRDLGTTKRGCAPSRRNLRIHQPPARAFRIRARGTRRVTALLTMPNTVANACQRAVFTLGYTAKTISGKPRP